MALAIFKSPFRSDYHGSKGMERKLTGTRRVFVQTETGCVLDMDLDRGDSVNTLKRRLQLELNVSTEECSLTFGDLVLNNDLSGVRHDSPLLLTRNHIHRSSSNPCLSPSGKNIRCKDRSGPIEILGQSDSFDRMKPLVKDIIKGMKNGVEPLPVNSGLGGAYYFRNASGESLAIVKPTDEEPFAPNNPKGFVGKALGQPGFKRSVRVGETGYREVAAYLLDYDHFANVPPTALVKITHSIFNVNDGVNGKKIKTKNSVSKIASMQQFIHHDFDASDYGTSSFPVSAVHRIGILDIRIFNTDRHAGNLLVRKAGSFGQAELIPIDHGLCLPENLEDPYFEWIHWPQSSIPFSEDEIEYIRNLDPERDAEMLRRELPMIREACLRVLVLCTVFLKEAVSFGLCLAEIGEMMSREFRRGEDEPSALERVCIEARRLTMERELLFKDFPKAFTGEDEFLFDLDCEEVETDFTSPFPFGISNGFSRRFLSKLDEGFEEDENDRLQGLKEGTISFPGPERVSLISKLSFSTKNASNDENAKKFFGTNSSNGNQANLSSSHRSANEQLSKSATFVKLADMNEDDWVVFLEKFQELLSSALAERSELTSGQKQRLRLGTSCKF